VKLSDIMSLRGGTDQTVKEAHVSEFYNEDTACLFAFMREVGNVGELTNATWDFPLHSIFVVAESAL